MALNIDPAQPSFDGEADIDVDLSQASRRICLHARDLRIASAWADNGVKRWPAKVTALGKSQIELRFARPLPAGRSQLSLAFSGRLSEHDSAGLVRQRVDGQWYAYSDFEPDNARPMAPMFGQPRVSDGRPHPLQWRTTPAWLVNAARCVWRP